MKRNHSLLEYTRDNDTQVSELGPYGPLPFVIHMTMCSSIRPSHFIVLFVFPQLLLQLIIKVMAWN